MKKIIKRALIGVGVSCAVVALLLIGLRLYIGSEAGSRFIREKINAAIPGTVWWDDLTLSVLSGTISLTNVTLEGPDGERLAAVEKVLADIRWADLLRKRVVVETAALERPDVRLRLEADGTLNIMKAFPAADPGAPEKPESQGPPPVEIALENVRLTDGLFRFEMPGKGEEMDRVVLEGIALTGSEGEIFPPSGKATLRVGRGDVDIAGFRTELTDFETEVALREGKLSPARLRLETGLGTLDVSGEVKRLLGKPDFSLKANLVASLEKVAEALSLPVEMSGPATVALELSGGIEEPVVRIISAVATYGDGRIAGIDVNGLTAEMTAEMTLAGHLKERRFTLDRARLNFDLALPAGAVSGTGEADLTRAFADGIFAAPTDIDQIRYSITLDVKNANLETPPFDIAGGSGSAAAVAKIEGTGVIPPNISASATVDITAEALEFPWLQTTDARLKADAGLEGMTVNFESVELATRESTLTGSGTFAIGTLATDSTWRFETESLETLLAAFDVADMRGKAEMDFRVNGSVMAPEIDAKLKARELAYADITIGAATAEAVLAPDGGVTLTELRLENQGTDLRVTGTSKLFNPGWQFIMEMPVDLKADIKNAQVTDFMKAIPVAGTIDGTVSAQGTLLNPKASLDVAAAGLAYDTTRIGDVQTSLSLDSGTVSIASLTLKNQRSSATVNGSATVLGENFVPLENPSFDLTIPGAEIFLADFNDAVSGTANLTATVRGKLSAPTASVSLSAKDLASGETRIGDLTAEVGFANGRLDVKPLRLTNGKSNLTLTGNAAVLNPDTLAPLADPTFDFKLSDAKIFLNEFTPEMAGTLSATATINGSLKNPVADIDLTGKGIEVGENRVGDLTADLRFSDGTVKFQPLRVKNRRSGAEVTGTATVLNTRTGQPLADPGFDLELLGDAVYLQDFVAGMSGKLSLSGDVRGTLNQPKGTVLVKGDGIDLGVQKISGLTLDSRLDGERVNIDSFLVAMAPGEAIMTDGWVSPLRRRYDLRMKSDGISIRNIDALKEQDIAEGKISFQLAGQGSFDDPQLEGEITVAGVRINQKLLQDLRLRIDIKDNIANISGTADFDIKGAYNLKTQDIDITADFKKTDMTPYFRLAGLDDLTGVLTGSVEAKGDATRPESIRAEANIRTFNVDMGGTGQKAELIRAEPFTASFQNGAFSVPGLRLSLLQQGDVTVRGDGDISGPLNLTVVGDVPMAVVMPFVEDLKNARGNLVLDGTVAGTIEEPVISATVRMKDIGMTVPTLGQNLRNLNGTVALTPDRVTISDVAGFLDTGRFELNGTATLKDFMPDRMDLSLNAETLPVRVPETLNLLLNADLTLQGTLEKSAVRGEVVLLEGRYFQDVKLNLLETIGQRTRTTAPAPAEGGDSLLDGISLDIQVNYRNPFVVDNNVALMTVKPNLRIYGTAAQPLISGRAEVDSGTITYQNKEFEVTRGVVDFLNPYEIEPTIDIKSQVDIRKWTIFLTISGTPENLRFKLTSDPPEEDGDILSLLTIGKTTRELIAGEGGTSKSPKQMVADIVASGLTDRLKEATGLDILEFEYQEKTEEEDTDEVRVTVGKELSRRMTVKYGVENRDGETVQKTTTEYKFLENLILSAFQDTQGNFGGELVFRMEFR